MKSSIQDLPVIYDLPIGMSRGTEWGGMNVSVGEVRQNFDGAPLFKGLPDDRCQVPHWGYVLEGRFRLKFADHEEVYKAGDVYYIPPGHTPIYEEGLVFIEFSPCEENAKQTEIIGRNVQAMMG